MRFNIKNNQPKPRVVKRTYEYPDGRLPDHEFSERQLRTIKRLLRRGDYAVVYFTDGGPKVLEPNDIAFITAMDEG